MGDVKRNISAAGQVKRRPKMNRTTTALILLCGIVVMTAATLGIRHLSHSTQPAQAGQAGEALFAVKTVKVIGNTRYAEEAVIKASGIVPGQSIWSVNKKEASKKILESFPYFETVSISSSGYSTIEIKVTETQPLCAIYDGTDWMVVGVNGKGLEKMPVESDRPFRHLYVKGARPISTQLGEKVLDDQTLSIITELTQAFSQHKLENVCVIDITNKNDIQLNWNNQITIKMGNPSNLTHQISVVVSALPGIQARYGDTAAGRLDVSSYSQKDAKPRAIFTPQELLTSTTTTTTTTTTSTTGTTVTTGTTTGRQG